MIDDVWMFSYKRELGQKNYINKLFFKPIDFVLKNNTLKKKLMELFYK